MKDKEIRFRGSKREFPRNKYFNSGNTTQTHVDVDESQWL